MIPRHEMKLSGKAYKVDEENHERFPVTRQAFIYSGNDAGKLC